MATKNSLLLVLLLIGKNVRAQDTTTSQSAEIGWQHYVNTLDMEASELSQEDSPSPSSLLLAGRNYFLNVYGFSFFHVRYRQRGYENFSGRTYINGVPVNSLETNSVQYGLFSGMSDVFRVAETSEQLAASDFTFGGLGNHFSINTSPSNQRNKLRMGYTFSNRNFQHRLSVMYNSGYSQKGWNYLIAFNTRYTSNGYYPGTFYSGVGYLFSVEKRIKRHVLSFSIWGSDYETGRQTATVQESFGLADSHFYNPVWGFQNGKKRNANILKNYLPTATINYKANFNDKTYWNTGIGVTIGKVSYSGLEWYNAPDPRPEYYRYLPSFYQKGTAQYDALTNEIKSNPSMLQIDWNKMYKVNVSQKDGRALYALGVRNTGHFQINAASSVHTVLKNGLSFSGGLEWQLARLRYYKTMQDLLGGQYWLNINAFVERDNPSDVNIIQNDIQNPDRKIVVGNKYGYDYSFIMQRFSEWVKLDFNTKKWDAFVGVELNTRQLYRLGYVQNGLFPDNSKGQDPTITSILSNAKLGVTYKLDGRKYIFLNAALLQQPSSPNTVYISPATRNFRNDSILPIHIRTVEGGFVMNTPFTKLRANSYFTLITHAAECRYFYDDVHQSFASYTLTNIAKKHYGVELALDYSFLANWKYSFIANFSRSVYYNHPRLIVVSETDVATLDNEPVYLKNYRIPNTPQTIVHNGLGYRNGICFFNLDANAFFDRWAALNPMRRTTSILQDINPVKQDGLRNNILKQEKLPNGCTLDLFAGFSFQVNKKQFSKNRLYIDLLLSANNLLDNKNIVSYAFEQMRLDLKRYNLEKFPNRYSYAMGRNYSMNIVLRF